MSPPEVEEASDTAQVGGELILGMETEIVGMRPTEDTCGSACYNVLNTIYDKLLESHRRRRRRSVAADRHRTERRLHGLDGQPA